MPSVGDGNKPIGDAASDSPKERKFSWVESALIGAYFGLLLRPFSAT
jgi:hypothetical protein